MNAIRKAYLFQYVRIKYIHIYIYTSATFSLCFLPARHKAQRTLGNKSSLAKAAQSRNLVPALTIVCNAVWEANTDPVHEHCLPADVASQVSIPRHQ